MASSSKVRSAIAMARQKLAGDPRSYFYGDATVELQPDDVAEATFENSDIDPTSAAIADESPTTEVAAQRIAAFESLSPEQKAQITLIPPVSPVNAAVIINPLLGKISGFHLNYNLTKALVEFPYAGRTFFGSAVSGGVSTITVSTTDSATYASPIGTIVISNSALNTPAGGLITITFSGQDASGRQVDTTAATSQYKYTIQRLGTTEPVRMIFCPFDVVATRTLSFMPIFRGASDGQTAVSFSITLSGLDPNDSVYYNVLGYASNELKEIADRLNLPAGMIL